MFFVWKNSYMARTYPTCELYYAKREMSFVWLAHFLAVSDCGIYYRSCVSSCCPKAFALSTCGSRTSIYWVLFFWRFCLLECHFCYFNCHFGVCFWGEDNSKPVFFFFYCVGFFMGNFGR